MTAPRAAWRARREGTLVDGGNRREGCRIAGVTPKITSLNGTDPLGYIVSANIHRRHMTRAQRAMIAPEPGGRGGRVKTSRSLQLIIAISSC